MIAIPMEDYIEQHLKYNPGTKDSEIRKALLEAVKLKQSGEKCINCGSPIWAIGTSLVGWSVCFSCITGIADSSEGYEIDTVSF